MSSTRETPLTHLSSPSKSRPTFTANLNLSQAANTVVSPADQGLIRFRLSRRASPSHLRKDCLQSFRTSPQSVGLQFDRLGARLFHRPEIQVKDRAVRLVHFADPVTLHLLRYAI